MTKQDYEEKAARYQEARKLLFEAAERLEQASELFELEELGTPQMWEQLRRISEESEEAAHWCEECGKRAKRFAELLAEEPGEA